MKNKIQYLLLSLCVFAPVSAQAQDVVLEETIVDAGATETTASESEQLPDVEQTPAIYLSSFGYLRVGYKHTQRDEDYTFIGRTSGFQLANARVGIEGLIPSADISFRVAAEGASDVDRDVNALQGNIDIRLRHAWARWQPHTTVGVQTGQFVVPFTREAMRSTGNLLFIDRAVGEAGVAAGTGLESDGISPDYELGAMLSSHVDGIAIGPIGIRYFAALTNGNGTNAQRNDNNALATTARIEVGMPETFWVGGAIHTNRRTTGLVPNAFREQDLGWAVDAAFERFGLDLYGQFVRVTTSFPTEGIEDRTRQAWHAQAGYTVETPFFDVTPMYRFASLDPWLGADGGEGISLDTFDLAYHSAGVRFGRDFGPASVRLWTVYTVTVEDETRALRNNTAQVLAQVAW